MIQVIERVEKILVYLSENRNREIPLTEIADNLGKGGQDVGVVTSCFSLSYSTTFQSSMRLFSVEKLTPILKSFRGSFTKGFA